MPRKNISKDVLNVVNKKSGKNVSSKDIQKLAGNVNPSTISNEAQLRQLIKQVSKMANVPVSASTENEIVQAIKSSGLNPKNLEDMMNVIMGKK